MLVVILFGDVVRRNGSPFPSPVPEITRRHKSPYRLPESNGKAIEYDIHLLRSGITPALLAAVDVNCLIVPLKMQQPISRG